MQFKFFFPEKKMRSTLIIFEIHVPRVFQGPQPTLVDLKLRAPKFPNQRRNSCQAGNITFNDFFGDSQATGRA